jgi:NAD(P)-dependent dehydrogenase (short-subunit alcohol dehydrogenase family)
MNNLQDRVAVITGATGTAGTAIATALAERGAKLALISHDVQKLEPLVSSLGLDSQRGLAVQADLLDPAQAARAAAAVVASFGRADILLHLVGGWTGGKSLVETPLEDYKEMLDQHVWTTIHVFQAFVPLITAQKWGRVIIISSPVASLPIAGRAAYAAAKAAQEALLLSLASELKGTGITANIFQVRSIDVEGSGRGTAPTSLASAILRLCSDQSDRENGERFPLY